MSHPDQLRDYARECLRLAQEAASPELKIHLINMAEAWAALAAQTERITALCATVTEVASPRLAAQEPAPADPGGTDGPSLVPDPDPAPAPGLSGRKPDEPQS